MGFSEILTITFLITCTATLLGHTYYLWKLAHLKNQSITLRYAKKLFKIQRELAEARFITHAMQHLDPSMWLWEESEFGQEVLFARNKRDRCLYAYMPVTVEMNRPIRHSHLSKNLLFLRQVTVVLQFAEEVELWQLTHRVLFNQSPSDVLQQKSREFHLVSSLAEQDWEFLE